MKTNPIFRKDYLLSYTHIDCHGFARLSALFEIMQDAATTHADQLGLSRDSLGVLWVLSRLRVQLNRPLVANEVLSLETECAGCKGATWIRTFRFFCGQEPIGEAVSSWVILDPINRRLLRPSSLQLPDNHPALASTLVPPPGKLRLCAVQPHHEHRVRYTDLDINQHLNNARIVDLISDALDLHTHSGTFIQTIQVNYTAESLADALLTLSVGTENNVVCIRGTAEDSIRFEAEAIFSPISTQKEV